MEYRGFKKDNTIDDSSFKKNIVPHSCDFIIAVYGGICFRLKGFINNDFYQLIEYYSENSDEGFMLKKNIFLRQNLKTFKSLVQHSNLFIEDLDLECYYKYYSAQRKMQKALGGKFCSQSCIYNIKENFFNELEKP